MKADLFIFLASFVFFTGCLLKDENFDVFHEEYDTVGWNASGIEHVDITTINGNIIVHGSGVSTVEGLVYKRSWGLDFADAEKHIEDIKIKQSSSEPTFYLAAEIPDIQRRYVASFDLTIPDSVSLDFFTINGNLTAEDIMGDIKFRSDNGILETKRVAGDLNLEVLTGNIGVFDHEGNVEAHTLNGSIYCEIYQLLPEHTLTLTTQEGSVTVALPKEASVNFDIATSTGKLNINDFDSVAYDRQELYHRVGNIGNGEATLWIRCRTGNITIQPLE